MNICIIGTGYVGLVAAACLSEMGNDVVCIDVNPEIIDQLKAGKVHIFEPGLEPLVTRNIAEGRLTFSTDLAEGMQDALFVFSCVGTPSMPDGSCDLSYVDEVATQIGQIISDYKIVINKSTVPVGTADRVKDIIQEQVTSKRDFRRIRCGLEPRVPQRGRRGQRLFETRPGDCGDGQRAHGQTAGNPLRALCPKPGQDDRHGQSAVRR